jgi:serine/threonine-protein kinase RsbW
MNSAFCPCLDADDDRFAFNGAPATPTAAAWIRDEFARWLRRSTDLDETRLCDVLLAVNETLANTAEFAYVDGSYGTVDVEAVQDPRRNALTVIVSDRGHWRETNPFNRQRRRGRGIPLMRTLADSVVIDTSGLGTSVAMRFDNVYAGYDVMVGGGLSGPSALEHAYHHSDEHLPRRRR